MDAMELAVDDAAAAGRFTPAHIQAIRARLMERGIPTRGAGRFRTVQNWIGGNDYNPCGADYVPPPPEHQLPAHPVITAPVAAAATGRSRPQTYQAVRQLEDAGVLIPLSQGARNRSWEAAGLLDLLAGLAAGEALGP